MYSTVDAGCECTLGCAGGCTIAIGCTVGCAYECEGTARCRCTAKRASVD